MLRLVRLLPVPVMTLLPCNLGVNNQSLQDDLKEGQARFLRGWNFGEAHPHSRASETGLLRLFEACRFEPLHATAC